MRLAVGAALALAAAALVGQALALAWDPPPLDADQAYRGLPPAPALAAVRADREIRRDDVRIPVRDTVLSGTVLSPVEPGRHPAVVLVQGSGSGRRAGLLDQAERFARAGIVALVYDKRTVGYSFVHRDYGLLADDAVTALRTLRQRAGVDPARLGLWGVSEGGWVVPIAANQAPEAAFAILVSAPAVSPLQQVTWALDAGLRRLGVPDTARRAAVTAFGTGRFDYVDHDPVPALQQLRQPVLALYGTDDRAVPVVQSSRVLGAALDRGGNRSHTVRFFAGADHGLRVPAGGFAPGYLDTIVHWVTGLPGTANPPGGLAVAGAVPSQQYAAVDPPSRWYTTLPVVAAGLGLATAGYLAGPVAALVGRHQRRRQRRRGGVGRWPGRQPAGLPAAARPARRAAGARPGEPAAGWQWRRVRRRLRWLTAGGIGTTASVQAAIGLLVASGLTGTGSAGLLTGSWLAARLVAVLTVLLTVATAGTVAAAVRAGWRPTAAQRVSVVGVLAGTILLLLLTSDLGVFAPRW